MSDLEFYKEAIKEYDKLPEKIDLKNKTSKKRPREKSMEQKPINLESEELKRLMSCFPKSFINGDNELILVHRTNLFLNLNTIYSDEDLKYRVISACSRSCVSEKSQSAYWARVTRNAVNMYLGTAFEEGDFRLLYSEFGNRCNEEEARQFIEDGMDITQFEQYNKGPFENDSLFKTIGNFEKVKKRLRDTGELKDSRLKENRLLTHGR
jgi:hypothetical protein